MARNVVEDYSDGKDTHLWSYRRFLYLHFRHDWHRHYDNLWKALIYVARYGKQPLDWALDLPESDLWRWVKYLSDAVKKEQPKK